MKRFSRQKLAIYVCATEGYTYALSAQVRRVQSCLEAATVSGHEFDILVILVGDGCDGQKAAASQYTDALPDSEVHCVILKDLSLGNENYKNAAQLLIAQMRTAATQRAEAWGADLCWSLDSDVLPPHNALRCMVDMLYFDHGYYQVAACPYPSQGGGSFLCGRGTKTRPILPCFYEDEKDVPKKLTTKRDQIQRKLDNYHKKRKYPPPELIEQLRDVEKEIDAIPPKDNVFTLNGKKWRQRGWFDNAYPAIGKGSVVPSDWCGFGCILMTREALSLCDWAGYDGSGTEDLFINWHRWHPNNIRIAAIPHAPCDHVVRSRSVEGKLVHLMASHEHEGECVGHLRQSARPWYEHTAGEIYREDNDGRLHD